MEVTENQLCAAWRDYFSTGTNWKDLDKDTAYEKHLTVNYIGAVKQDI